MQSTVRAFNKICKFAKKGENVRFVFWVMIAKSIRRKNQTVEVIYTVTAVFVTVTFLIVLVLHV